MKGNLWLIVIALLVIGGLGWLWLESSKPLSGDATPDLGREHITDIYGIEYNSNPPTSGKHFPVWAKAGVYDRVLSDGYLIHSLEHGYVVVSYNCEAKLEADNNFQFSIFNFQSKVSAHGLEEGSEEATDSGSPLMHMSTPPGGVSWWTPESPPPAEVQLPESFNSESCKSLVAKLSELTKAADRVIVVPRLSMDKPIALTAWGRIFKMDNFDKGKAEEFVKAFHNKGPEKTME